MKNKVLIFGLLGAGAFLLYKKMKASGSTPDTGNSFELPPEYTGGDAGRGGRGGASSVVPFTEPVSAFIPAGSTNWQAPTATTKTPETPEELTAIADDIRNKWRRWKVLIDTPVIAGTINSDYTLMPGPQVINPIYKPAGQRTALNTPVPNIPLIPNLMSWFWNNNLKHWVILERTA